MMKIQYLLGLSLISFMFVLRAQDEGDAGARRKSLTKTSQLGVKSHHQTGLGGVIAPKGRPMRRPANAPYRGNAFVFTQCVGPDGRFYNYGHPEYQSCVDGEINDLSAERQDQKFINAGILFLR